LRNQATEVSRPGGLRLAAIRLEDYTVGIIGWIILGLLAGAIAKILLPGRDPGGMIGTTLIGVAGAFLGGWLSARFLDRPVESHFFDLYTWGAAIGGSLVLLVGYRLLFGNSRN
jgi:uncharacterized membrane protein YeaQ/YmgE (transglycosylase-associated protein family)